MPISAGTRVFSPLLANRRSGHAFVSEAKSELLPPDIEFLARHGVAGPALDHASARAAGHGTSAVRELVALGLDEKRYWSMLAQDLGLDFLDDLSAATLVSNGDLLTTDAVRIAASALVRFGG